MKKKLSLDSIRIESFATSHKNEIKGGSGTLVDPSAPAAGCEITDIMFCHTANGCTPMQ